MLINPFQYLKSTQIYIYSAYGIAIQAPIYAKPSIVVFPILTSEIIASGNG